MLDSDTRICLNDVLTIQLLDVHMQAEQEQRQEQQASTLPAAKPKALAKQNGEGDVSSISGSILQQMWPLVLRLGQDVSQAQPTASGEPSTPSVAANNNSMLVRRSVMCGCSSYLRKFWDLLLGVQTYRWKQQCSLLWIIE